MDIRADDTRAASAAPSWRRMRGSARSSLIGLLASGLFAAGVAAHEAPQRVASLNLCADQLVLQLADREQIASLSALAKDRSISFLADAVGGIPLQSESEVVLFDRIDLVLVGRYGTALKRSLLERHAVPVLVLDVWTDLAMGREQIRVVAERLGHPERGEGLIAEIDAAMARARDIVPGRPSLLAYYRRGWVPGPDTLVGDVLRRMGFRLQQDAAGPRRGGVVRLESMVADPPDFVLLDEAAGASVDNGSALLVHPALARTIPASRRLQIPARLGICGGPSTPAAIDALAAEVRAKLR